VPLTHSIDETMLFALTELEKMKLIVRLLVAKGVLTEKELALTEIESKMMHAERYAQVEEDEGRSESAREHRSNAEALRQRLNALKDDDA
jgi:hypothetical protein